MFICVIDIPFKCSPWNEKGVAPEGDGLNLKRISLAVNEVTPDSKISSKSVSIRIWLSAFKSVKVLLEGKAVTRNSS